MFRVSHKSVVGVFQGCDCRSVMTAELEEIKEMFRVVSDVCEVDRNIFVF